MIRGKSGISVPGTFARKPAHKIRMAKTVIPEYLLQNCDAEERRCRKLAWRKHHRDTIAACKKFLRDHPDAPGDAIWNECPTPPPTTKREPASCKR